MPRALTFALVVSLSVSACGDPSPPSDCVAEDGAEVCVRIEGGTQITGHGLEPGSDLTIQVVDGPREVVQVDEDGSIGAVGFLTTVEPTSVTVEISGTAGGGEPLVRTLSVE